MKRVRLEPVASQSFIKVTEGKNEKLKKRQNEDKDHNFHLHNTLCLPEGVQKV